MGTFGFTGAFIIFIIGFVIYRVIKKRGILDEIKDTFEQETTVGSTRNNTVEIEQKIKEQDELFSTDKFISWAKEVFITIQTAWQDRDWNKVRPFESEKLYRLHELQLQGYINDGLINKLEEINVNKAFLAVYKQDEEYEHLTAYMEVRMIDYVINEKTEEVIKGNKNMPVRNKYLLTFMRKKGVKTNPATSNMSTTRCPNCNAPIQVTSAGKCEYCDFIVTTGEHDWVLNDIESI